jgi:hypothetical protein
MLSAVLCAQGETQMLRASRPRRHFFPISRHAGMRAAAAAQLCCSSSGVMLACWHARPAPRNVALRPHDHAEELLVMWP